jgi:hypothetical protein
MRKSILFLVVILVVTSCGKSFKKSPIDKYITELDNKSQYSIILNDMDVQGTFFKSYMHKFKIIYPIDTTVTTLTPGQNRFDEVVTDWVDVGDDFFWKNEKNLGMTLVSKSEEGKITRSAHPPGYNYVGNQRYGRWQTQNDGSRFWSFYGQYMFMNHMFGVMHRPIYYSSYNSYRGGYYGSRPYYGSKTSGGSSRYGTNSTYTKKARPDFHSRKAAKSGWTRSSSRSSSGRSSSSSRGWGSGK